MAPPSLLSLPYDIRIQIYTSMTYDIGIGLGCRSGLVVVPNHSVLNSISAQAIICLTLVCRQTYDEVSGHLFRDNIFCFKNSMTVLEFVTKYPATARQILYLALCQETLYHNKRKLFATICYGTWIEPREWFNWLAPRLGDFAQLQSVHFFSQDPWNDCFVMKVLRNRKVFPKEFRCRPKLARRMWPFPARLLHPKTDPNAAWIEIDRYEMELNGPQERKYSLPLHIWKRSPQYTWNSFKKMCRNDRAVWLHHLDYASLSIPSEREMLNSFRDRVLREDF